jgi:SAM-dependent methyltransferase
MVKVDFIRRVVAVFALIGCLCVMQWRWNATTTSGPFHTLPASVSLDVLFGVPDASVVAVSALNSEEIELLSMVCTEKHSAAHVALFRKAVLSEFAKGELHQQFATLLLPGGDVPARILLSLMCMNATVLARSSKFAVHDVHSVPPSKLLALLARIGESGYGENPESQLRTVIRALHGGDRQFERGVFVDLGSGRGRVLAAACTQQEEGAHVFDECIGIEGSSERVAVARDLHLKLQRELRDAGVPDLAKHLNATVHIEQGDLRSALLASEVIPRSTHIYMYNTMFGDLDFAIAAHIAKNARRGLRVAMHTFNQAAWPSSRFRVASSHERGDVTWTKLTIVEVV